MRQSRPSKIDFLKIIELCRPDNLAVTSSEKCNVVLSLPADSYTEKLRKEGWYELVKPISVKLLRITFPHQATRSIDVKAITQEHEQRHVNTAYLILFRFYSRN
jgi:hypothetical protein